MISNRIRKKEGLNYKVILLGENGVIKQAIQKIYFLKMNNLRFFMIYYKRKLC